MPQPRSFKDAGVDFSTDGVTWTSLNAYKSKIDITGGQRPVEDSFVFAQDFPYETEGKREGLEIKGTYIYTEDVAGAFALLRPIYELGLAIYMRIAPHGYSSGNWLYTSDRGFLKNFMYPKGEAKSGSAIMLDVDARVPRITESVIV
jgi:hypothetical protein